MSNRKETKFLATEGSGEVSAIIDFDHHSKAVFVFAHGAGAPMTHTFMEDLSQALLQKSVAVFRFNFPYMEGTRGRPDPPARATMTIDNAAKAALSHLPGLPLFIGGKSFGGRMSSQLAAKKEVEDLKGLVYVGFPLHAPGKEGTERAAHLADIKVPQLFLQGTRDALAKPDLIKEVTDPLDLASVIYYEGADHSFKVLKSLGISHEDMMDKLSTDISNWISSIL